MDTKFQPERRKFQRKGFSETPWLFTLVMESPTSNESTIRLEPKNIGMGGLKFLTNKKIPLFQKITVQVTDKTNKNDPMQMRAEVIRVEESDTGRGEKTYGIATKFIEMPKDSSKLQAVLSDLANSN